MDDIIKNFSIEHFYMPDVMVDNKTFQEILIALNKKGISYETPQIEDTFSLAETKLRIVWISNQEEDLNNTSIVLQVIYKNTSFLLTSDITSDVERIIQNNNIESDVYKVAHHGSKYSNSSSFLKKVNPKYAIIMVGKENDYGFPKQIVLDKLNYLGVKIYRTDQDGTIIARSDGNVIYFDTQKTNTDGG